MNSEGTGEGVDLIEIDQSLWETDNSKNGKMTSIAEKLIDQLSSSQNVTMDKITTNETEGELSMLKSWLSCNRSCFSLADICKMPSLSKKVRELLMPYITSIKSDSTTVTGSKVLLETLSSV